MGIGVTDWDDSLDCIQ